MGFPIEKFSHNPRNTEDPKLPQSLLLIFFCLCVWKVPKIQLWPSQISVLKILFDMWEAQEDRDCRESNLESFSKYDKVKQERFWEGTYAIGLDMYSPLSPNCRNLSHASTPGSIMAHCALTHTVDPGFVISVYDTVHWSRLGKPAWLLKESTRSGWVPAQQRNRGLFIQAVK